MKNDFENREQRVLDNVKDATLKTKANLGVLLETYKTNNSVIADSMNNIDNNNLTVDNDSSQTMQNNKKLVRTMGTPYTGSPNVASQSSSKDAASPSAGYNYPSGGDSVTQSQSGNASTGTLIFVFIAILVVMVFAISYYIFSYFGI